MMFGELCLLKRSINKHNSPNIFFRSTKADLLFLYYRTFSLAGRPLAATQNDVGVGAMRRIALTENHLSQKDVMNEMTGENSPVISLVSTFRHRLSFGCNSRKNPLVQPLPGCQKPGLVDFCIRSVLTSSPSLFDLGHQLAFLLFVHNV
jgi:hypothetical protein